MAEGHLTSLDDAAWTGPWRGVRVEEKVVLSVGLVLSALAAPSWPGTLAVAVASVLLIVGPARIPVRVLGVAMAAPVAFLVLGSASVAVSVGGGHVDALAAWGPLAVSPASLAHALDVLAHGVAGTSALMVLATTTPMIDLLTWLRRLRVPDPLIEVASLTYRLLFVLLDTAVGLHDAHTNRLGGTATRRRRWRVAAAATSMVLVRAWDRAERLQAGLQARGFESALVTLPVARSASWPFRALTAAVLALLWMLALPAWAAL